MKRILGLSLLLALFSLPLLAAKNSQVFTLSSDVRVGDTQLPRGHWYVTWTEPTASVVQLTIKTEDKTKTVTVPARIIEEKQSEPGVGTSVVNGVTYVQELHTTKARFIIQSASNDLK